MNEIFLQNQHSLLRNYSKWRTTGSIFGGPILRLCTQGGGEMLSTKIASN